MIDIRTQITVFAIFRAAKLIKSSQIMIERYLIMPSLGSCDCGGLKEIALENMTDVIALFCSPRPYLMNTGS